jgi:hypothetical protein
MNVTLYQMKAWNQRRMEEAIRKAQQERTAAAMAVMKRPAPQQGRLI